MWTTMGVESNKKYANEALTICKKVRMWVNFFMRKNKIRHKLAKVSTVIFTCALSTEERLKEISISLLELLYHESLQRNPQGLRHLSKAIFLSFSKCKSN